MVANELPMLKVGHPVTEVLSGHVTWELKDLGPRSFDAAHPVGILVSEDLDDR